MPSLLAGRYRLDKRVGGGMSTLYQGFDTTANESVAVKLLTVDPDRNEREISLLKQLRHPRIVEYRDHGVAPFRGQDVLYLITEWLPGPTLLGLLRTRGFTIAETATIGVHLCDALTAVHTHGVIHRDVKPSNVLFPALPALELKLIDFGIARPVDVPGPTRTGSLVGTPGYMAPEQARGQRKIDARADLFALGCVLYEALAGRAPFAGAHPLEIRAKIVLAQPPSLEIVRPDVPADLRALVMSLLAKDPNHRPASAADVAAALRAYLAHPSLERPRGHAAPSGDDITAAVDLDIQAPATLDTPPATRLKAWAVVVDGLGDVAERTLIDAAAPHGGRLELLAHGSAVVTSDTTALAEAARTALAIHAVAPEASIAVAAGDEPTVAVERATRALTRGAMRDLFASSATTSIHLDGPSAQALLADPRFAIAQAPSDGFVLHGLAR